MQTLNPSSVIYNESFMLQFDGELDIVKLKAAMSMVALRQPNILASFAMDKANNAPYKKFVQDFSLPITRHQAALCDDNLDKHAKDLVKAQAAVPFDMDSDLLIRMFVLHGMSYYFLETNTC